MEVGVYIERLGLRLARLYINICYMQLDNQCLTLSDELSGIENFFYTNIQNNPDV